MIRDDSCTNRDLYACTSFQSNQLEKWNNKNLKNKMSILLLPSPSLVRGPQPAPCSSSTTLVRNYGSRSLLAGRSEPKQRLGLLYLALPYQAWPQTLTHLASVMSRIASMFIADMPRRRVRRIPSSMSLCRAFSCRFSQNHETHHAAIGHPADSITMVAVHHHSPSETSHAGRK